jgi:DNA-binding response OmpR family regulator
VSYDPKPIDTSNVKLTPQILELREVLARNAHEIWSRQRFKDGWRFGAQRDDPRKEHPCLIPYEQLPESEKEYDRLAAMETLKTIVGLGYEIRKSKAS